MAKKENKSTQVEKEIIQASKKASEYRNRAEEAKKSAQGYLDTVKETVITANEELEQIKKLKEDSKSLSNEIKTKESETTNSYNVLLENKVKVENLINSLEEIIEEHPELENELAEFEEKVTKIEDTFTKLNTLYKSSLAKKQEIDQLHIDIEGYEEENEDTGEIHRVEGLKDKLEEIYTDLSEKLSNSIEELEVLKVKSANDYKGLKENWESKYITLEKQITDLLPNALTAGLSSAYSSKKSEEEKESKKLVKSFNVGLFLLVVVSTIPFIISYKSFIDGIDFEQIILRLPRVVFSILPLYIPVLWLAYSSNKKMNLSKRLIEEYTHKEVLSKTFEGLSKQIRDIEDAEVSNELKMKLLYNILEVSSENPGKLITDYNKSDHPLMDALEKSTKFSKAVEKLEGIPGFGKLSQLLEKRSNKILSKQAEKINEVLDNLNEKEDK